MRTIKDAVDLLELAIMYHDWEKVGQAIAFLKTFSDNKAATEFALSTHKERDQF